MNPIDELTIEHGSIKIMLRVLEKIDNPYDIQEAITFIKEFADKCHHGKEEDLLFPVMKINNITKEIKLIDILIKEHEEGREYVKNMASSKTFQEFSKKYIVLLDQHINKENMTLFPSARLSLSQDQIKELEESFEDVEINKIGLGRHKELRKIIEKLRDKYL